MYHASLELHTLAPDFALPCTDRHFVALHKHLIGKPLVLFFFPKCGTPSSIEQALSFKKAYNEFCALGITVLGVSQDTLTTQLQFKAQNSLPFDLLADAQGALAHTYKAVWPWLGLPSRTTYVLSPEHIIDHVVRNARVDQHPEAILAFLEKAKATKPKRILAQSPLWQGLETPSFRLTNA